MYYDTKEGDDELRKIYDSERANRETNDDEPKTKKKRRNEVSMLVIENENSTLSPTRTRRAAATRQDESQRHIDEFLVKKRSPTKSSRLESILPPINVANHERCPMCNRLISNDILEVHTNACVNQRTDAAQASMEKVHQRTKTEAKVKEVLFARTTRQNLSAHLIRTNSETTTCSSCGMQMTVSRLENQHKNQCQKSLQ